MAALIISNIQAIELAVLSLVLVMHFAPVILHLFPGLGFIMHDGLMPDVAWAKGTHVISENGAVAGSPAPVSALTWLHSCTNGPPA